MHMKIANTGHYNTLLGQETQGHLQGEVKLLSGMCVCVCVREGGEREEARIIVTAIVIETSITELS